MSLTPFERVVEAAKFLIANHNCAGNGGMYPPCSICREAEAALSALDATPQPVEGPSGGPYRVVEVDEPGLGEKVIEVRGPTPIKSSAVDRPNFRMELESEAFELNAAYAAGQRSLFPLSRPGAADEGEVERVMLWIKDRSDDVAKFSPPGIRMEIDEALHIARALVAAGFRLPDTHNTKEG